MSFKLSLWFIFKRYINGLDKVVEDKPLLTKLLNDRFFPWVELKD